MYLVLHGNMTSTKTVCKYVEHIVYGAPKITGVLVGSKFVALLEYEERQQSFAFSTFERMGSFGGIGALIIPQRVEALLQFGSCVYHYAPSEDMVGRLLCDARRPDPDQAFDE